MLNVLGHRVKGSKKISNTLVTNRIEKHPRKIPLHAHQLNPHGVMIKKNFFGYSVLAKLVLPQVIKDPFNKDNAEPPRGTSLGTHHW